MKHPFWLLLVASTAAIGCGMFVGPAVLALGASLLALGIVWPWVTVRGLSASLRFRQTRGREGEPVEVAIELTNAWPWPAWGLRLSRWFHFGTGDGGMTVVSVGGWTTETIDAVFYPPRRGLYPLETPALETAFPFGLFSARKTLAEWNSLVVSPATTTSPLATIPQKLPERSQLSITRTRRDRETTRVSGEIRPET